MMFTISPLLARRRAGDGAGVAVDDEVHRRQGPARGSSPSGGTPAALNAQAEEVFTGHAIVKSFGRQREAEARFRADNDELYEASFGAQFMSSLIQPMMIFIGNIQFVLIAVVGGLKISNGAITVGDMQAMIQYARQFSQPLTQLASMAATFQSGIASMERVLELLDADEQSPEQADTARPRAGARPGRVRRRPLLVRPDKPLIEGSSSSPSRARRSPSSGRPAPARRRSST